jgi:hypothetical protein
MKKVAFILALATLATLTSCAGNGKKPTVFIPCVVTGDNPADRSECECRMERRIHQRDTAYYRDAFFEHNAKQGRTFWAAYIYAF